MKKMLYGIISIAALFIIAFTIAIITISSYQKENKQLKQAYVNAEMGHVETVNRLGNTVAQQKQTIISQKAALESGLLKIETLEANNIKLLQSLVQVEEYASNLETIVAGWSDDTTIITAPEISDKDLQKNDKYLKLPASFLYDDPWLTLAGNVVEKGIEFEPNGVFIPSEPQITIGWQNKHESRFRNYFSRPQPVVVYENNNPYFHTTGMQNIVIDNPPKWYQRNITWFGLGVAISTLLIL